MVNRSKKLLAVILSLILCLQGFVVTPAISQEYDARVTQQEEPLGEDAQLPLTDEEELEEPQAEEPPAVDEAQEVELPEPIDEDPQDSQLPAENQEVDIQEPVELDEEEPLDEEAFALEDLEDTSAATAVPHTSYRTWVQGSGWQGWKRDGALAGSEDAKRLEAMRIRLVDGTGTQLTGIEYQVFMEGSGWQSWVADGATSGSAGKGKRVEAVRIRLTGELKDAYDVWYRVNVQEKGWLGWAANSALSGSTGKNLQVQGIQVTLVPKGESSPGSTRRPFIDGTAITLTGHVQKIGWTTGINKVGTTGRGLRIEAITAKLSGCPYSGGIEYEAHVQSIGWQGVRRNGQIAGTQGRALRVEAFSLKLTGQAAKHYDLYYRVHVQSYGWLGWACNGQRAGSQGFSKRTESIQIRVVAKGAAAPSSTDSVMDSCFVAPADITYATRSSQENWQGHRSEGRVAGHASGSLAIEQMRVYLNTIEGAASGSLTYEMRDSQGSWSSARAPRAAGTVGVPVEALRITLTGDITQVYTLYYRAYVEGVGWLQWTTSGRAVGSARLSKNILAIQAKLVAKGQPDPTSTSAARPVPYLTPSIERAMGQPYSAANARQRRIVSAALSTPTAGPGYCAAWVQNVYENAGFGKYWGDACDLYDSYCHYSSANNLKVGMIIAVRTHNKTYMGSIYGHVGIYVGDGWILDNISANGVGKIRKIAVMDWIEYYGEVVTPKWGWLGNLNIA